MKKTIKTFSARAAMMLLATLLLTLTAQPAWADEVNYIDASGSGKSVDATAVTGETTVMGATGTTTWYYVSGEVENDNRIELLGTVNLILADGCDFHVNNGFHLASGNTLNIYAQSAGNGYLIADHSSNNYNAAIGGNGGSDEDGKGGNGENAGNVNIYGGVIRVDGNLGGGDGGIGGDGGNGGNICIYGGSVIVYGITGGGNAGGGDTYDGNKGTATIKLSWTNVEDYVYAGHYNGVVTLQKAFTDEGGNSYAAGAVNNNAGIQDKKLLTPNATTSYEQAEATCTEDGYKQDCWFKYATQKYYADEACTEVIDFSKIKIPALGHNVTIHIEAQGATFTTGGNVEYWQCERCSHYFGDAAGKNDLELDDASSLSYGVKGNATDGYSIRMPKWGTGTLTIDSSVSSFKIYDDGGEGGSNTEGENDAAGNYSNNCDGRLVLIAPENYAIQLTGNVMTEKDWDYLTVYHGTSADENYILLNQKSSDDNGVTTSIGTHVATSMLLYFHSDGGVNCAGLDLTATLFNATPHTQKITIATVTGGEVTGPATAINGEMVALTVSPAANYVLSGITVKKDDTTEYVEVTGADWYHNQATFYMPATDVTVTPTFTNDLSNLSVNIPKTGTATATIPSAVTSFKIYDDGGSDGNYSNDCDGNLVLTAPDGKQIQLTGDVLIDNSDNLTAYSGTTTDDDNRLFDRSSNTDDDGNPLPTAIGTHNYTSMLLHFYSDEKDNNAGLNLTARLLSDEYINPVFYVDADGVEQMANNVTTVTSTTTTMGTADQTTWYSVNGYTDIDDCIELKGTVNLILTDDCHLFANEGMHLAAGNTLNIFTQSTGSGKLSAGNSGKNAAIGGNGGEDGNAGEDGGNVNVYGGKLSCNGPLGGGNGETNGTATIKLSWTNLEDEVYAFEYNGTVTLLKAFTDSEGNSYAASTANVNDINETKLLSANATVFHAHADATCTKAGYTQDCWFKYATQKYYTDEACTHEIDESAVVIPALSHDMMHTAGTAATFSTKGNVEYWYCSNCHHYFGDAAGKNDLYLDNASSLSYGVEGNASDGYSIRIPKWGTGTLTIDSSVSSFKIYDDGGEGGSNTESYAAGNYSDGCDGGLVLIAPENYAIQLTGDVMTEKDRDYLTVYHGTSADENYILLNQKSSNKDGVATSIGTHTTTSMLLYFHSDDGDNYAGLDLTATLVSATPHNITIAAATGGEVTGPATAINGEVVALTVTPAANYVLSGITVTKNGTTEEVEVKGADWYHNQATFYMPGENVTVTPTFTNDLSNLSVNIPKTGTATATIPSAVTSFKIYDDGGSDGNYSNDCDGNLVLTAPDGKQIQLTGDVLTDDSDYLTVYSGTTADDDNCLFDRSSNTDDDGIPLPTAIGTHNYTSMLLHFYSDEKDNNAGLNLTARLLSDEYVNPVFYVDADGVEQMANNVTTVTSNTTTMGTADQTTWYSVNGYTDIDDRIELAGEVNLILTDDCYLDAFEGMHLAAGNTLNIFTQSTGSGKLSAGNSGKNAAIGGNGGEDGNAGEDGGNLNLYGGKFSCDGPLGGGKGETNGTATIKLSWTNLEDELYVKQYNGTVTLLKAFTDSEGNSYAASTVDVNDINEKELLSANATVFHAHADATCTKDGYTQDCWFKYATQKYYTDAACTHEIDKNDVVIPALGHNMTHTAGTAATFTTAGSVSYWHCSRCKNYFCDERGEFAISDFDISDVAFGVEGNATDGYSIRMPKWGTGTLTIDSSVSSFKIYDDGGEGGSNTEGDDDAAGNYSDNCDGRLVLTAPEGYAIQLKGSLLTEPGCDFLTVYTGTTTDGDVLFKESSEEGAGYEPVSTNIGTHSAHTMLLRFNSDGSVNYAGLDLTATLVHALVLLNDDSQQPDGQKNADVIDSNKNDGLTHNVILSGRTLTKDGNWNTLCLPFNVTAEQMAETTHPFYGATIKELNTSTSSLANDGTLTLSFNTVNSITAGKPYIVKWETTGDNIEDPIFNGVTITSTTPTAVKSSDQKVTFVGQYSPFSIGDVTNGDDGNLNEIIMLGSGSKLGYSKDERTLKCFRAHFYVKADGSEQAAARRFVMNFDDGTQTGICHTDLSDLTDHANAWYSLDGRKLNGVPTKKGVYVQNGKKVVIK